MELQPGRTHNRLTLIRLVKQDKQPTTAWECLCSCGKTVRVNPYDIRNNRVKSCGCWRRELGVVKGRQNVRHGRCHSSEWLAWKNMRDRCLNPKSKQYRNYGGRGITICAKWLECFENFFADMGEKPSKKHSLDRHPDPNGNYEPGNCRWATHHEQQRNRRWHRIVEFRDESLCVGEWAERFGLSVPVLWVRLFQHNWSVERAMTTPVTKRPSAP